MCGICGFVGPAAQEESQAELLRRMTATLAHRGPDGTGYHLDPGVALGVRRLSIIDLEHGDQPITNEDGQIVVVANCEIYNFKELRADLEDRGHRFRSQSDVEVIVHLYEDLDTRFVDRLRGMFALALWDSRRRRLILARDRFGIKPLSYCEAPTGLFFASEVKALAAAGLPICELDPLALRDLLRLGFVLSPRSMFQGVRRLLPGQLVVHEAGATSLKQYWQPSFPLADDYVQLSEGQWSERLRAKLREAVEIHLRSDVEVGALLSPGLDSSAVVRLALDAGAKAPLTYSLSFDVSAVDEVGNKSLLSDDPRYGLENRRAVCGQEDLARLEETVWFAEEPTLGGLEVSRLRLATLAAGASKVVLTGEGSDEILGGYRWYHGDKLLRPLANLPRWVRYAVSGGPLGQRLRPATTQLLMATRTMNLARFEAMITGPFRMSLDELVHPDLLAQIDGTDPELDPSPPMEFDRWHPFCQLQYIDLRTRLVELINHTLDRAFMARSIEARLPFLDPELVELCNMIPPRLKMKGFREKHILRHALRGLLPKSILKRPKYAMVTPIETWLRGPLTPRIQEAFSPASLVRVGYFNPQGVNRMLERHRQGHANYGGLLMGVAKVQIWHDLFVRQRGLTPPNGLDDPTLSGVE
jgi:asparagine synthase (glutamine-hydrolysing)